MADEAVQSSADRIRESIEVIAHCDRVLERYRRIRAISHFVILAALLVQSLLIAAAAWRDIYDR